ncbi:MAG: hypothetical protein RL346_78 [Verrucomicrobiota bacterium]
MQKICVSEFVVKTQRFIIAPIGCNTGPLGFESRRAFREIPWSMNLTIFRGLRLVLKSPCSKGSFSALDFVQLAGRWKSIPDVVEMLRRNPEVDLDEVGETCRKYPIRGWEKVMEELEVGR